MQNLKTSPNASIEKAFWETELTTQFKEMIAWLEASKNRGGFGAIIGKTGAGKTYTTNKFCLKHPEHTYKITVSDLHTLQDIMNELLDVFSLNGQWRTKNKLDLITKHVKQLHTQGCKVMIIIDEAENLKIGVIRMLKALYDRIGNYCSIMLIGTPELLDKLERMKKKQREGVEQFYSRIKSGIKMLTDVNKDYAMFLNKYVEDKGLRKLLISLSDNYRELHDYLYPVIREVREKGLPLTEHLFRLYHSMPMYGQTVLNRH